MKSSTEQFMKVIQSSISESIINNSGTKSPQQKKNKLNLFGKGITCIKILSKQQIEYLIDFKELDLSHNALTNIQNLKVLPLEEVNLSHNKIHDQDQLMSIFLADNNCQLSKNICKIQLKGNPFLKRSTLLPEFKRWLFSVENDLDLYTREQQQYLQLLVQRFIQKVSLENMLNKIALNTQFINEYNVQKVDDYEKLLLTRPEDYFKILKRQMQWKTQQQPLLNIKKYVVVTLPIELFTNMKQKSSYKQYASSLIIQLKAKNQSLIKINKQTMKKIQNHIFNYLTFKKMNLEKKQKRSLNLKQLIRIPIKQKSPQKNTSPLKSLLNNKFEKQQSKYLQIYTPAYSNKLSPSKIKRTVSEEVQSPFQFNLKYQNQSMVRTYDFNQQRYERNPFDQIIQQVQNQNDLKFNQKLKCNQTKNQASLKGSKKIDLKNTSKTLFELSQSLLQRPVPSDDSVTFQFLSDLESQSQIQKMFNQILTKTNPIFHLLYSPLESLKTSEKDSLITNLLELLKQKLKHIQKMQRFKVLFQDLQKKYQELSEEYKCQTYKLQQSLLTITHAKKESSFNQKQIEKLSSQIQSITQLNISIKQENQKLLNQVQSLRISKLSLDKQQQYFEIIGSRRQKRLKRQYYLILSRKSQKLKYFITRKNEIKQKQKETTKQQYFNLLKHQTLISKNHKKVRTSVLAKSFAYITQTLKSSVQWNNSLLVNTSIIKKYLRLVTSKRLISNLKQNHQSIFMKKYAIKCSDRKLKKKLFAGIKQNYRREKEIQYEQIVLKFRIQSKQRLKKWVFGEWLIWQRGLLHKQIQVRVNHQGILACNIVTNLCNFYSKKKSHEAKSLALDLYLRDIRKFNYFHKFYMFVSLQIQKWKLKLFKINMFTKRTFFEDFAEGIRNQKLKRKIKEKDHALTQRKLQFGQLSQYKLRKKISIIKTKSKIRNVYFQIIKKQMLERKKQFEIQNLLKINRIKSFFDSFLTNFRKSENFKLKVRQLYYLTSRYRKQEQSLNKCTMPHFLNFLKKQNHFKKSLTQFFIRKNKRIMFKSFYSFRVSSLKWKAEYFQQKLRQLGPDIDLIQQRQIQTNIEKIGLIRQMQLKNKQLEQYYKEVKQLKLLLEAKQIKYEKLKDIYAQSIQINSRERDIYELDDRAIVPQYIPYEIGYSNINSKIIKQDNMQNTLKLNSRSEFRHQISNLNKYQPERDTKRSQQKRRITDFVVENQEFNKKNDRQKNRKEIPQLDKISQFYPSFRRF